MKKCCIVLFIGLCFWVFATGAYPEEKKEKEETPKKEPASTLFIKYTPPKLGKPGKRVGGGTRGSQSDALLLAALAPDHTGMAASPQPTLCWFISKPTDMRMEIILDDGKSIRPVLETKLGRPQTGDVYCARLAEYGIRLEAGLEYQWFVAVITDPEQRSKDIVTGGSVMYREPSRELARKLSRGGELDVPALYAADGYWYDAFDAVTKMIRMRPADERARAMRAQLLEQAGLDPLPLVHTP
jgi:hypothetical protein